MKFFKNFILYLLVSFVLTGCFPKKDSKKKEGLILKKEETFYRNLRAEPENLHPIKSTDYYSTIVQSHILESLLQRNPETYVWEPSLAQKWEQSPDGKSFVFYLHEGIKWSDGRPLTAKDVKFSLEAYKNPTYGGIPHISYYENLKSAEVIDLHTVRFQVKAIYHRNFSVAASMPILPEHVYRLPEKESQKSAKDSNKSPHIKKDFNLNQQVIGSGPYKIIQYKKGKMIVLAKNPNWFGKNVASNKGRWNFQNIVFRFISESNDAILRMQKGDLDLIALSAEDFEKKTSGSKWGSTLKKVKYTNKEPAGYIYVGFNFKNPLFQDRRVRKALTHLMNRELVIDKFQFGYAQLATGPWYSWSEYADPEVQPILFDPAKAVKLLQEAGWSDSNKDGVLEKQFLEGKKDFSFSLLFASGNRDTEKYLTIFQEDLKKAGIRLSLRPLDWTSFLAVLDKKSFDACLLGWSGGSIAIDPMQIWHSRSARAGGSNYISYSNAKVDKLIDAARRELNKKKRIKLLREVYRLIADDVPYIFLFNRSYKFYGVSDRIHRPSLR